MRSDARARSADARSPNACSGSRLIQFVKQYITGVFSVCADIEGTRRGTGTVQQRVIIKITGMAVVSITGQPKTNTKDTKLMPVRDQPSFLTVSAAVFRAISIILWKEVLISSGDRCSGLKRWSEIVKRASAFL